MNRRQFLAAFGSLGLLTACTPAEIKRGVTSSQSLVKGDVPRALSAQIPKTGIAEVDGLIQSQLKQLIKELSKTWGDKKVATPKEYVKYTDHYQSRAIINFSTRAIQVETLAAKNAKSTLKSAIVATLLTPEDPSTVDLLSDKAIISGQKPFLSGLVLDQDKKSIETQWRAERYADLLMKSMKSDTYNGKSRHFVTFNMVKDTQAKQEHKYAITVQRQSQRFGIQKALIYAIIQTESDFNPYAMSPIPAYGLMQIVPQSAGRDAHELLYNKAGTPSKNTLFNAEKNIEFGTAYLHILFNRYLVKVKNSVAREYCCIAAYNTGSGNVLKAFDNDRTQALKKINNMNSQEVYNHLRKSLKYEEARNYLRKVVKNKKNFG